MEKRFKLMDRIEKLNYEKDFRIAFLESKGDSFQYLFEKLMSKAHPGDFIPCRPWGNIGDRKNDGYLSSERTLFQIYAPNELKAKAVIHKIIEDFVAAKKHWREYFDKWFFVHNGDRGLSPNIIETIGRLRKDNHEIEIIAWGYQEMLIKFQRLQLKDLESWFGPALTTQANLQLGFHDLETVLKHINIAPDISISEVRDVSSGKIEANFLSQAVAEFLKVGMSKAALVGKFFDKFYDPTYGDKVSQAFKNEYLKLKDRNPHLLPDEIFGRLEVWAGGNINTAPKHKAAVLAVMAYFFEKCEIFEDAQTKVMV